MGQDPRQGGGRQRRPAQPPEHRRLLRAVAVRRQLAPAGRHARGEAERQDAPGQLDRRVHLAVAVVQARPMEDRDHQDPDRDAEGEAAEQVRGEDPPRMRGTQQRVEGGHPRRPGSAREGEHDHVQAHVARRGIGRTLTAHPVWTARAPSMREVMRATDTNVPAVELAGSGEIPQLGFGVFQVPPPRPPRSRRARCRPATGTSTPPSAYQNEAEVGQAVRASGLERDEVFVTTKCFNDDHGFETAKRACRASLDRLELDFVDLYLIHWPVPRTTATWRPGGPSSSSSRRAWSARSACPTSSPRTCAGSSTRPA